MQQALSADKTYEEAFERGAKMTIGDPPVWDAPPIWETWKELPSPKVGQIKVAAPRLEQPPDSVHSEGAVEANPDSNLD
jgi:hypothetical protein